MMTELNLFLISPATLKKVRHLLMHINHVTPVVVSCKPTNVNFMLVRGNVRAGSPKSLDVVLCVQKGSTKPIKPSDKNKVGNHVVAVEEKLSLF